MGVMIQRKQGEQGKQRKITPINQKHYIVLLTVYYQVMPTQMLSKNN